MKRSILQYALTAWAAGSFKSHNDVHSHAISSFSLVRFLIAHLFFSRKSDASRLNKVEETLHMSSEVYEKVACWCEMNDKEKSLTIEEAEVSTSELPDV